MLTTLARALNRTTWKDCVPPVQITYRHRPKPRQESHMDHEDCSSARHQPETTFFPLVHGKRMHVVSWAWSCPNRALHPTPVLARDPPHTRSAAQNQVLSPQIREKRSMPHSAKRHVEKPISAVHFHRRARDHTCELPPSQPGPSFASPKSRQSRVRGWRRRR